MHSVLESSSHAWLMTGAVPAGLCKHEPYRDAQSRLHGKDRNCTACTSPTMNWESPMMLLLLYLHLLAQLYTILLFSLALARLEYGLCHSKVTHLPFLHQLLYHCLHMRCEVTKKEDSCLCHAACCLPCIKVSMAEKMRNCFATHFKHIPADWSSCHTMLQCSAAEHKFAFWLI